MSRSRRIAVVGGGTLGLYMASLLAKSGQVTVIEPAAGPPQDSSQLLFGDVINRGNHDGLDTAWTSTWGGTSTRWGGQLLPWERWEIDGSVGQKWPITFDELAPRYEDVLKNLGLSPTHSEVHARTTLIPRSESSDLRMRFSTWMTKRERDFSRNRALAPGLRQVNRAVGWRAVKVHGRGPFSIELQSSTGARRDLEAHDVVFAAGVLGNTQLVARSFPQLIGVGQGFMDHVSRRVAAYEISDWRRFLGFAGQRYVQGVRASPKIVPSSELLTRFGLHAGYAHWEFSVESSELYRLVRSRGRTPPSAVGIMKETQAGLSSISRGILTRSRPVPAFAKVYLRVDIEQRPTPERRVNWQFSEVGKPSLDLRWDASASENSSAARLGAIVVQSLDKAAIGVQQVTRVEEPLIDTKHLMGGLQMGDHAADSVTDRVGRLHGVDGAWIVGASVFPSGGIANPTFTAMALAERTRRAMHED